MESGCSLHLQGTMKLPSTREREYSNPQQMEKLRNGLWTGTCPKLHHKCLGEPEGKARSVDSHRFTYACKPPRPSRLASETHEMPTAPIAVPTPFQIILLVLFAFPIMLIRGKMILW